MIVIINSSQFKSFPTLTSLACKEQSRESLPSHTDNISVVAKHLLTLTSLACKEQSRESLPSHTDNISVVAKHLFEDEK